MVQIGVTAATRSSETSTYQSANRKETGYAPMAKHQCKCKVPCGKSSPSPLKKLSDLAPNPRNPRKISDEALGGLERSLSEFGDISGIVWNTRTRQLIAGHQRLKALRQKYGDGLQLSGSTIVAPDGEVFPVRVVDWPAEKAKAAMVAANNTHVAGQWTEGLKNILDELSTEMSDLFSDLNLDMLFADVPFSPADAQKEYTEGVADEVKTVECPKCGTTIPV